MSKKAISNLPESFDTWCRTAVSYIPRFRRRAVYAELYSHIWDHYTALLDSRDPEAAARMALAAMGSAEETGRRLRRSEWSLRGMLQNAKDLLSGSKWVVYYRGSDVKQYSALIDQLTQLQIPFRKEELDGFARSNLANLVPGRFAMDNPPAVMAPFPVSTPHWLPRHCAATSRISTRSSSGRGICPQRGGSVYLDYFPQWAP